MINEGAEGQVNLKTLFNRCNKEYFGGAVPKCKIEWSGRIKKAIGRAHVRWKGPAVKKNPMFKYLPEIPQQQNIEIDMNSFKIQISKSFDMSEDDIKGTMLHEMVHILLFSQRKVGGHHGTPEFDGWIKRLREMAGIRIPFKESDYKPSPKLQSKEGLLLIVWLKGTKFDLGYNTYSPNFMRKNWMMFTKVIGRHISTSPSFIKAEMYKVSHPAVSATSPKRGLKTFAFEHISQEQVEDIRRKGTLFFKAEYSKGGWIDPKKGGLPHHGYGVKSFDKWGEWDQNEI